MMWTFIIIVMVALVMMFMAGWLSSKRKYGAIVLLLFSSIFFMTSGLVKVWNYGRDVFRMSTSLEWRAYEVLATVQKKEGLVALLCNTDGVSDCRAALFKAYPPASFTETEFADGRRFLVPAGKQVVVGDPKKMEFIP
ncbi:MAG: hypothetical protein ACYC8S_02555 [Minisyncoccota bacterium]